MMGNPRISSLLFYGDEIEKNRWIGVLRIRLWGER
jgi:hypothetical protein